MRSEERLGVDDEVRTSEVTEERACAGGATTQVTRDDEADGRDAHDLERVTRQRAEAAEVEEQRDWQCGRKPGDAKRDEEIRPPLREPVETESPPEEGA